jgi:hypothetical protein
MNDKEYFNLYLQCEKFRKILNKINDQNIHFGLKYISEEEELNTEFVLKIYNNIIAEMEEYREKNKNRFFSLSELIKIETKYKSAKIY